MSAPSSRTVRGRFVRHLCAITTLSVLFTLRLAGQTLYWDANGTATGSGATPTGTWSTASGGVNNRWNSNINGTTTTPGAWLDNRDAVFSAGTNGTNAYTVTVDPFATILVSSINIQEGTPTFTGGTITLNNATPNFTVGTGRTTTVNSDIAGTNGLNKLGAGTLILGTSDKSYSGTTTISAGFLNLAVAQTFDTVNLSGGTLTLSGTSTGTTITNLNVTATSTIDFGGAVADLTATTLTISAGVTLNIINWTNASDHFFATNWTNAAFDTTGATPMNQVVFNSPTFAGNNTRWLSSGSHEITPLPEPSAYGALLLAATTGLVFWRRRRVSAQPA